MYVETSLGCFSKDVFIDRCNAHSFPSGLMILYNLYLEGQKNLIILPESLSIRGSLTLVQCTSLAYLPVGLQTGLSLNIKGCASLVSLPPDLKVGGNIYADDIFLRRYPFKDIPKILHLPFFEEQRAILLDRLSSRDIS